MVARLERDISRCSVRRVAFFFRIVNGHLLCVQSAQVVVPTLGYHGPVLDENAPHQWIRADLSAAALGHQERVLHEHTIAVGPVDAHAWPTRLMFMTACITA